MHKDAFGADADSDYPDQPAHIGSHIELLIFFVGGWGGGGYISLKWSQSFIKSGRKPENPGKNHLTICKQNLAFPHVTQPRLEP